MERGVSALNTKQRGVTMNFTILIITVEYITITYAFGLLYKLVGSKNSTYIQRNMGWTGYCILGSVGVTFHELSHWITAVLFRHKINEVKLFRPFRGKIDGTLGYVNHSWNNKSMYQKVGNFFIGTAPMFFGAGLLFVILRIAYPSSFAEVVELNEIPNSLAFSFSNMFTAENMLTWHTAVVVLIIIFICPHMHMSWADVKGSIHGAIALIMLAFMLSLTSFIIPNNVMLQIQGGMNTFVTYYIFALVLGLIMSIIMTVCFGLASLARGKGL
jgi:hypothetical protein